MLTPGDEILAGRLFRRIPNWRNYFDVAAHRPRIGTFRPRAGDQGDLSVHLEALASLETIRAILAAHPLWRSFGLCALDVAAVRDDLGDRARVIYQPDATDPHLGHAHAVVTPLHDDDLQAVLLRHAVVLVEPQQVR